MIIEYDCTHSASLIIRLSTIQYDEMEWKELVKHRINVISKLHIKSNFINLLVKLVLKLTEIQTS